MEIQRSKERAKGEGGGGVEKQRAAGGQGKGLGLVSEPWFCPSVCQAGGQPWAGATRGLGTLLLPLASKSYSTTRTLLGSGTKQPHVVDFLAMREMSGGHTSSWSLPSCNPSPENLIPSDHLS